MSKSTVKVVEIDTNPAVKSIKDLRKELMEYKNQMANLEEGSDAFLEVANKAGETKHQIDEINESIKGASSDFGDMVGNVTNVAAGITGAFQAVAGGLQAMGVESEALDETIAKMQGLMAITQGLSAIDDGVKSFGKLTTAIKTSASGLGKFKTALIATGLGALVVVLGSIIANWDEFSKAIGFSEKQLQKFGDIFKGVLNSALSMIGGVGKAISRLIAGDFKGAGEAVKEGFALQKNFQIGVQNAERERTEEQRRQANERVAIERDEANKKHEEFLARENEKLDIELERIKRKDLSEKESLKAIIEIEKRRLALMKEGTLEYERQLTDIHELEKELNKPVETKKENPVETKEQNENTLSEEEQKLRDYLSSVAALYLEVEETDEQYFKRREEELAEALKKQLISEEEYTTASKGLSRERTEYQKAQNAILIRSISDTVNATSSFITSILDGIADQQDTNNREGFEKSKKLQIASATIGMLTGITNAISGLFTTKSGPWDIALAAIQAASIAASGAVQINKIKSTKFDGGAANVSAGAVNATIIPPVQFSSAVQGASTESAIKDTKVYVTESDIVNTIGKVNVQESENTY